MAVARYVIIDADGVAVNAVLWDKRSDGDWTAPEGCTVALESSAAAQRALAAAQEAAAAQGDRGEAWTRASMNAAAMPGGSW